MSNISEVRKLRIKCAKHNLSAPDDFWTVSDLELSIIYNGCGADWMPKWSRVVLSMFMWLFAPAFLIHDFRFSQSDKTKTNFKLANSEMLGNMSILNDKVFPPNRWWSKHIHRVWDFKKNAAYVACKHGAWKAWVDSAE